MYDVLFFNDFWDIGNISSYTNMDQIPVPVYCMIVCSGNVPKAFQ